MCKCVRVCVRMQYVYEKERFDVGQATRQPGIKQQGKQGAHLEERDDDGEQEHEGNSEDDGWRDKQLRCPDGRLHR